VQDAFLNALRSCDTYRGDAAPLTWLYRIVVNASVNHCRKRNRREHAYLRHSRHPIVADAAVDNSFDVRMALQKLTPDQCRVFVMYEVIGHTHREIAGLLAIPSGTSKWRLAEARRRLQELLFDRHRTVKPRRRRP